MLVPLIVILGIVLVGLMLFGYITFLSTRRITAIESMLKANKTKQVIRQTKRILAKSPHNADAHYLMGMALLQEKKPELALMELKTVNQIGDFTGICREVPFRRQIADLYWKFNQRDEALKEYLLLIRSQPAEAEYYFKAGQLFEERGHPDKSIGYFARAIQLEPDHGPSHFHLGLLYMRQKRLLEARKELETAIKIDPDNADAHFHLGKLLKESHDYAAALTSFEKAQRSPELRQKVLVERGACFMSMNNFERAISELERAVKVAVSETDSVTLYGRYFLAMSYEKNRQVEKAISEWEKIYAQKPTFRDVSEKLTQYQDLRADDSVKDYLTASRDEFIKICQMVALGMGMQIQSVTDLPSGGAQIYGLEDSKRLGTRKLPRLIRFYRTTEPVDDAIVRETLEEMKKNNVIRGVIVSSSIFTRKALEFAESRPIDLYDRDRLQELLKPQGSIGPI